MTLSAAEKLAAFLVAPDEVARPDAGSLPEPDAFRALVETHNLPLDEVIAVNGLRDDPLAASPCIQAALEPDRARHLQVREEFIAYRERLDAAGIPHVLTKAVSGVPYRSSNMDILIPDDRMEQAERILVDLGYLYNRFSPDRYKILYNRITCSRLTGMVHLHRNVSWYSPFIEANLIFQGTLEGAEAGVRMPSPEVSLAVIGCHALYEDACIRFIELHKIRCVLKRGPLNWDRLWEMARYRGFASGLALFLLILDRQHRRYIGRSLFDDAVLGRAESHLSRLDGTRAHYRRSVVGDDLESPYRMSKYFVRRCLLVQARRCRLMNFRTKVEIVAHILREGFHQVTRWFPQPGMVLAICGPDGCGKSTQVERVAAALAIFEIRSEPSWLRIGDSPVLNFLKRPFRCRVKAQVDAGGVSEQGVFKSALVRRLWPVAAVTDYVVRQYLRIGRAYLRERIVIADRYHVDALVDLALRCGPDVLDRRWIIAALRMLPKARPAFVLYVPRETLIRRRADEHIPGVTDRVDEYYRKAAERMGAIIVDGRRDPEVIADEMTREAVARFFRLL